ncbi:MAG: hydroxyacid dehydrogenase [Alphaproteobacteria bacterium]|nr:hydroxyacid dehydrogenase [Alphaproteobacteria bacterium]MBT7943994.1 hydroxyacid dehydrogenase [Alphaproteobacteria bacterium]
MTTKTKKLVYFEKWMDPVAESMIGGEADIDLQKLHYDSPVDDNWATVEAANGIQFQPAFETQAPFLPGRALIERCPDLLALSVSGTGYDTYDVEACTENGILVVNQAGANAESVAQHVVGMMLVLSKQIIQGDRQMRIGPDGWGRDDFKGRELTGRTIGIIGLGNVGRRVSALAGKMFNMTVLAYDPYITEDDFYERGAKPVGFDDIFSQSDFVSVNCPLTEETTNMIGDREYRMMKPSAFFVTTARGGIHDEAALAAVLSDGLMAGAGLDVFDPEPPASSHPLLAFDNVIVSPHVAGITDDSTFNMASWAAEQWVTLFQGHRPPRLINPEAWDLYCERFERITGAPVKE